MNSCIINTTEEKKPSENGLIKQLDVTEKQKRFFKNYFLESSLTEALDSASYSLPDSAIKAVTITFREKDNLSCSIEVGFSPQCPLSSERVNSGGFIIQNGIVYVIYDPFIEARQEKYLDEEFRLNPALDSLCAFNSSLLRSEDNINIIGSSIFFEFVCKKD